jgi:hypothetical protein
MPKPQFPPDEEMRQEICDSIVDLSKEQVLVMWIAMQLNAKGDNKMKRIARRKAKENFGYPTQAEAVKTLRQWLLGRG